MQGGDDRGPICLWDVAGGKELRRLPSEGGCLQVAFTSDGCRLLSGHSDGWIRLRDVSNGEEVLSIRTSQGMVEGVALSPDGRRILSAGEDDSVRLWDAANGKELFRFEGHTADALGVAFAPDGRLAASGSKDGTVRLLRLPDPPRPPIPPVVPPDGPRKDDAAVAPKGPVVEDRHTVLVDVDLDAYQAWLDRMRATGYRPNFVNAHATAGGPRFAALAVKAKDVDGLRWEAYVDPTGEANQRRFDEMKKRGRLIGESHFALHGSTAHATLWDTSSGGGGFAAYSFRDSRDYERKLLEMKAKNMRPAFASPHPMVSSRRFSVIFRTDDGTDWMARPDLTAEQFRAALDEWRPKGYYPASAAAYPDGDTPRFALVMVREDPRREWAERHGLTMAQLLEELEAGKASGHHPTVISGYRQGGESRYLAVWVQDTPPDPPALWTPGTPDVAAAAVSHEVTIGDRHAALLEADLKAYQAWLGRMRPSGFRPTFVNAHDAAGGPRFAALAVKDETAWEARLDTSPAAFENTNSHMSNQYTLVGLSGYPLGGSTGIASLWVRARPDDSEVAVHLDGRQYQARIEQMKARKMMMTYATAYPVGDSHRFSALFGPAQPSWVARHNQTAGQVQTLLDEWRSKGYYPISAFAYPSGGATRFGLMMVRNRPYREWAERHDLTTARLLEELEAGTSKGYRPTVISGYGRGTRAATWPSGCKTPRPIRPPSGHRRTRRPARRSASRGHAEVTQPPQRLVDNFGVVTAASHPFRMDAAHSP
jgi:hypothetical protein